MVHPFQQTTVYGHKKTSEMDTFFCIDSKRCLKDQLWHHDSRSTSTIKKKQCQTVSPKITDIKVTSTSKILSTNMSTEVFHKIATRPSLSIFWIFPPCMSSASTEWWQSVDMPKSSGVCHEDAVACLQKASCPHVAEGWGGPGHPSIQHCGVTYSAPDLSVMCTFQTKGPVSWYIYNIYIGLLWWKVGQRNIFFELQHLFLPFLWRLFVPGDDAVFSIASLSWITSLRGLVHSLIIVLSEAPLCNK